MRFAGQLAAALIALALAPAAAQAQAPQVDDVAAREKEAAHAGAGVRLDAEDVNAWLDGYLPYALKAGDIAGAIVVAVKDGEILTQRGYGYADVAERTPVDPTRTLFRMGSVGKLFTWTAVMQLVEQGRIDLDADVNTYLDFEIPARDGEPVTMRNLMQHAAGFEEQAKGVLTRNGDARPSFESILKRWTPERIYPPAATPAYSNYGASLAGYIVQRVSGESYHDYIKRHIFEPLEMSRTTSRQPLPPDLAPWMSEGYGVASEDPRGFEFLGPAPAGGHTTTGENFAHFMIAHLQKGEFRGRRILRPETVEQMHSSELTIIPGLNRMKLGFFETDINGRNVSAHYGDTADFHTTLHLFMDEGVGLFVSFNSAGANGVSFLLRQALFEDFANRYFPGDGADGRVDPETAAEHAAMMAGNWRSSRRSESNVLNATGLVGQISLGAGPDGELVSPPLGLNMKPRRWIEIEPFVWRDANSRQKLAAQLVDGKPVRFSVDMYSPIIVFDRVAWRKNAAWLLPLLIASVIALALTVVAWPAAAVIRRRYGAKLALQARALNAYRASRIAAAAMLAGLAVWAVLLTNMFSDLSNLSAASDPILRFAQIFGAVAFIGGFAIMARNVWLVWNSGRSWFAKTWSIVMTLSALTVLYVAIVFKLIGFGVYY